MATYNVLVLGGGYETARIFLGVCRRELRPLDAAVFPDLGWSSRSLQERIDYLRRQGEEAGVPLVVLPASRPLSEELLQNDQKTLCIPHFTLNPRGRPRLHQRTCVNEYKTQPVLRWIRQQLLGLEEGQEVPEGETVCLWFGVSEDRQGRACFPGTYQWPEKTRKILPTGQEMRMGPRRWIGIPWLQHVYPLLNAVYLYNRSIATEYFFDRRWQSQDCQDWLQTHYPDFPPANPWCLGCPIQGNSGWRWLQEFQPEEWNSLCSWEQEVQKKYPLVSFSPQMKPLAEVDLSAVGWKDCGCGTVYDGQDGWCGV